MKNTKKSLLVSVLSLMLCVAMLLGTTYAWFTDSVTSGKNTIVAGNLDVELYHKSANGTEEEVTSTTANLFKDVAKWEPGAYAYETFTVKNVGDLALKYSMRLNASNATKTSVGDVEHDLTEVLKVKVVDAAPTSRPAYTDGVALKDWVLDKDNSVLYPTQVSDTPHEESFTVVIYWEPGENDNWFNLNNERKGHTPLSVDVNVVLEATQYTYEEDSFDKFYDLLDDNVILPTFEGESEAKQLNQNEETTFTINKGDEKASATVPAGTTLTDENNESVAWANERDQVKLSVKPDGNPDGVKVKTYESIMTYDVSLIRIVTTESGTAGEAIQTTTEIKSANKPVMVALPIGVVDLKEFYHHGQKLTKVDTKEDITDEGMYWYDQANGDVYFMTKSFSPFASVYPFAGGLGTSDCPYLIENEVQFMGLDEEFKAWATADKTDIYFDLIDDMDMAAESIQSEKGTTWSRARWFDDLSTYPNTKIYLNLNDHSINNLDCFLFAEVHNMEMINGTVNFVNGNNSKDYVPGIIYFCDPTIPVTLSFNNLTLNGDYEVNMSHYGPVIAQCYGGTNENAAVNSVSCENVVSNVKVWNVAGNAYTGGIFGYVGSVTATIKDSKFNGYIQSAHAGGFMNPMKENTLKLNGSGNVMNGSILATSEAQEFGAGNTKNLCTKTENAHLDMVTVSTGLLDTMNIGDEIKINHTDDSIKRYAVSIMAWTNHATCTTVFNVNVPAESTGTLQTGLYKNYFENTRTDGSTPETKQNSGWYDGCIWLDGNTYKVYCSDTTEIATNHNATIYVYGYKEDGTLVTYQSQSYSPANSSAN